MKVSRAFTLDSLILKELELDAEENERKVSTQLNVILADYFSKKKQYKMVTCIKCEAVYSEKLKDCPSCVANEIEAAKRKESEEKERELNSRILALTEGRNEKIKRFTDLQDLLSQNPRSVTPKELEKARQDVMKAEQLLEQAKQEAFA